MMNWRNPDDATLTKLLERAGTIAVYGCSPKPDRTSHRIAASLIERGYNVIPVHPKAETILGQKVYPTLADIPVHIDIVNVFRRAEFTPDVARQAVEIGAGALWLQQGIINEESYRIAKDGGLIPVMDLCIAVIHRLLVR
ncbi:MAG: CoA-binding protein [Mariprofundaceae bacterium]|nr:CoA-binding protein [Mariprofundaceae bacterium]